MAGRAERAAWWRHSFDDEYYRLHAPLFPEAQSRSEVASMIELLGLPNGARVLDAPCGWGRHTLLLAEAGFRTFGTDLSLALLRRARTRRKRRPLYAAADVRALPFAAGVFDAVLNVFTSLGIFHTDADDVRMLREARRVLAPGGRFLLETMHRDDVVRHYATKDRWSLPDGTRITAERTFDPVSGLSRERWVWSRGTKRGEREHVLRLRTATEVAGLIRRAGFRDTRFFGDWDGSALSLDSPRLIALATVPGSAAR
ncbi:MAG: class I SAM-dependent methyltransferase [Gemmatimonadota bacterium]|jgi:ubiquinone/menaquinone biosynthesis C-methylase UbiE